MKKGRIVLFSLVILAICYIAPVMSMTVYAADEVIYNANTWSTFKDRTKGQIANEYYSALRVGSTYNNENSNSWYKVQPSITSPYVAGELTTDTHKVMTAMTNYYRWLVGAKTLKNSTHSDAMQAEALIRNFQFDHNVTISKPANMDDELWNLGSKLTHNVIAMGFSPRDSITGWLDEGYCLELYGCLRKGFTSTGFNSVGHRIVLLSQARNSLTFGYSGNVAIGKYTNGGKKDLSYVAYPAPGYMPYNNLPANTSAWDVELNKSVIKYRSIANVVVTVTNKKDNTSYNCTKANGTLTEDWGALVFKQPSPTNNGYYSDGDVFEVVITGLIDVKTGKSAKVVYTVEFFDMSKISEKEAAQAAKAAKAVAAKKTVKKENPVVETSISVTAPTKNTYKVGEAIDVTGGKVNITYSNGTTSTIDLTENMISDFSSSNKGISTVTVNYNGKTTTFDVLVVGEIIGLDATHGDMLSDIMLPTDSNGTYSWKEADTLFVGNVGENLFEMVYTPNDSKYSAVSMEVTIYVAEDYTFINKITSAVESTFSKAMLAVSSTDAYALEVGNPQISNVSKPIFYSTICYFLFFCVNS